jgi:hypothetical protein
LAGEEQPPQHEEVDGGRTPEPAPARHRGFPAVRRLRPRACHRREIVWR